jgi:hypothetical protein
MGATMILVLIELILDIFGKNTNELRKWIMAILKVMQFISFNKMDLPKSQ